MKAARTIEERLRIVGETLLPSHDWASIPLTEMLRLFERELTHPDPEAAYLLLAVVGAAIPTPEEVQAFARTWLLDGFPAVLRPAMRRARLAARLRRVSTIEVTSGIVIDGTDTGRSSFTTGIQRVARETVSRWRHHEGLDIVVWTPDSTALRRPTTLELQRILDDDSVSGVEARGANAHLVVPYRATFVLPEIAVNETRSARLRTLGLHATRRSVAIGFDCIAITSAETSGLGMPGAFARYLSALAQFDHIATISAAAEIEFEGWRSMLAGTGLTGPAIEEVQLPFDGGTATPEQIAETARVLDLEGERILLSVGSYEPRKNRLNLIHAAELAWRRGSDFTLVLVGGNAWRAQRVFDLIEQLRRRGRKIVTLSGVDDVTIWSLYSLARASIFPSLNEGFGLPVVESLVNGTPVITSDFGSMRELGEGNGALLVDPHDPQAIAAAIVEILDDEQVRKRLTAEAARVQRSTWDDYASALWRIVTEEKAQAA